MKKKILYVAALFLFALFAYAYFIYKSTNEVIIEDHIVGHPYEIISVNGSPPERIQRGLFILKIPYVIVEPGFHKFVIKNSESVGSTLQFEISAPIRSNCRYKIDNQNGKPQIFKIFGD